MKKSYLYEQIYNTLKENILTGSYQDGEQIPTEKQIIEEFGVSRLTAKNAINLLAEEGLVTRIPGKGTFVSNPHTHTTIIKRKTIGLIFSGFSDSFGTRLLKVLIEHLESEGFNVLFKYSGESQEKETSAIEELLDLGVDGLVILPVEAEFHNPALLQASLNKLPVVLADRYLTGINLPYVGTDNVQAASQGINTLFENGHEQISIVYNSKINNSSIRDRLKGIEQAYTQNNLTLNTNQWITELETAYSSQYSESSIQNDIHQITKKIKQFPNITAFFALDYMCSELVILSLEENEKEMPKDFSLLGFDGSSISSILPKFTRIVQNEEEIALNIIKLLISEIEQKSSLVERKILVDSDILNFHTIKNVEQNI